MMCGIAGIWSTHLLQPRLHKAVSSLRHRGPDSEGFYMDDAASFGLGSRRLCILDRSEKAAQPLRYSNRYVIVHNGELYNYLELKKKLSKAGLAFATHTDTEVIAAAYAFWGTACLQRFDGAFAFAIWDEAEKTLFAARDRTGEKPFFFCHHAGEFLFASELKALWAAGVPKVANKALLYNYLTLGYTANPFDAQQTFYRDMYKLPAACFLTFSAQSKALHIENYYRVAIEEKDISDDEAIYTFRGLLHTSINRRLRSDVPLGISLSGGLDSSSIAAICAQGSTGNRIQHCFTASFAGYEKDEAGMAAQLAAVLRLPHHVVPVTVDDLLESMDALSYHQEEPVGSASVLAQYKVHEAAKKAGITVLLDGQGADELLAGYQKYYHWYWQELYAAKMLAASGELTAAKALGIAEDFSAKNKMAALFPHVAAALWQRQRARKAAAQKHLTKAFVRANKHAFAYAMPAQLTLNGALHYNTFINGLEELLRYADRNSMAHGVEVRTPFLSHEIIDFLFTLPPCFKIRRGWTKWLLRESMKNILPEKIVWQKLKVGFEPPQKLWMQHDGIQEQIRKAKKILVEEGVLAAAAMSNPVKAAAAHEASLDWRYWSASYLFK